MIGVLGISHKSASLEIRELFSISKESTSEIGELILRNTEVVETLILSTCNRTEIYFYKHKSCGNKTAKQLIKLLHEYKGVSIDYSDNFYFHSKENAVNHIFSVTSGLKSMVFGEEQIVKQVKEAYMHSTNLTLTDAVLMRLFQKSFETNKRVRTETDIQKGSTSVSYMAVDKCSQFITSWKKQKVLLIGTGETGGLVIQKLKKLGVTNLHFSNRTLVNAVNMAKENGGEVVKYEDFKQHLHEFDIVITTTAAGEVILKKEDVNTAITQRDKKSQVYIDLSVPRNIDSEVQNCLNTNLLTVDSLLVDIEKTEEKRKSCRADAEKIISEMGDEYLAWLNNRSLRPVIKAITDNMQKIHTCELEKYKKSYSPEVKDAVDEYASRLTQKYIRTLIKNLRELNENGNASQSLKTINSLFEFESENK